MKVMKTHGEFGKTLEKARIFGQRIEEEEMIHHDTCLTYKLTMSICGLEEKRSKFIWFFE
jgi:hypothetical protein